MTGRIHVILREQDRARIDLICATHGVSKSDVVRLGLVALSRQLGYETEIPTDFVKNIR